MPTIRIDEDVYSWLKSQALPFEDSPNSVLRKLAGLDRNRDNCVVCTRAKEETAKVVPTTANGKSRRITGKYLKGLWKVDVVHALYHHDGTFFENLQDFPGGLFDFSGYVVFNTQQEYNNCSHLSIGQKLNVHDGIASIPGYKRMR
jgi:predicted CopG family antitoxin